ncbi:glycine/betaine ABC transporter [Halobacteriales archaeon QH_7_66_36]|nr:MAG: glycine/betaine ABC transporter [Halobacteriales archaeon QH_7_66_36]
MGTSGAGQSVSSATDLLVPVCAVSGGIVLAGFFFPEFVGRAVSGGGWLALALVFFASGLGYLALLPYADGEPSTAAAYLLRVRRTGVSELVRPLVAGLDPVTTAGPVAVFAAYFAARLVAPTATGTVVDAVSRTLLRDGSPFFLGVTLLAVAYCLFLLFGSWGDVRLGGPDAEPSYTYPTYFTLVFTAGIAAGVVFWGPAEALFHYRDATPYFAADPRSTAAAGSALTYTLFHWGVSAWSAYAALGVPIAYFVFQRGAPLRVAAILTPFLGADNLDAPLGRLVDALAVFATIGGIATSVALVSEQFLAGIGFQWGVDAGNAGPVLFVGGLTLIFVVSAATGVHRGIRRIAGLNVGLFLLFGVLLAAVGPWGFISAAGASALGSYAVEFLPLSLYADGEWVANWTVWNWSWWFSWAPFAGLFIAALSRGRKIRTVVFTGSVATAAATAVWFLLFGGAALWVQQVGRADVLAAVAAQGGSEAVAGFPVIAALPLSRLLIFLFLALIIVFMVTSADTSTLVVSVLATRPGVAPSTGTIAVWGLIQGAVATAVLVVGGGETLQALAVLTGGPFALLSVVALAGLTRTCYRDERGHTSLVERVGRRLPTVPSHRDIDPPEED